MKPTKHYAALLYRLADEIQAAGTTAIDPEQIREAAQRMDEQTVEINQLRREIEQSDIATLEQEARQMRARMDRLQSERDELLAAIEFARDKISELHLEAGDGDCHYPIVDDAIEFVKGTAK